MKYFSKFLSLFLVGAMLYATGCTDYDQDIKDLNNKVDELEQTLQGQIDPLKADLEAVQTALEAAIADGEELKAQHEEDVKALQEADAKAQEAIEKALEAMEAGDAELDEKIADAVAAIEAANGEIAKLQTVDAEIKENLKTLEDSLKTTQGDVESLKEIAQQLVAWSANVDGTLAAMNTEIEGINESIEALEGDVESLKIMIQQHDMWIQNAEGRLGNLEEFKAYAEEQFELLAKADKDLNDLVANLQTDFADYQKIVNEQLTKAFAEIGENTAKINALTADLEAKYNALVAADEAMQNAIAQHEEWITNAEARINNLQENIESVEANLKSVKEDFDAFKTDVSTRLRNAEGSIGQLQVDVQGLNDKLNEFKAAYDEHIAAYEEFVKKTNEAITNMQAIIDAIIGRVQSIAFVPEYVDGKATINWATFGNRILEGRSVLVYQVYPAECAAAIANAPAVGDVVSPLSFDMTDALKTRGGLDKAPQMNIVGVEGDEDGRLYVTVEARNFGEKFYAGEVEYAASLVLTTENENLASCYTNLVALSANKVEAIKMRAMATDDVTLTSVNEGAEFEDVTGNKVVYTNELTYADIENNPDFVALPGYYLEFNYNGEWYTKYELLAQYGIEVGEIKSEWSVMGAPMFQLLGQASRVLNETTGYTEINADFTKVSDKLVGVTYSWNYQYYYPGSDEKIYFGADLKIVAEQRTVNVGEFTETWIYSLDSRGDAGEDIYSRSFTTTEKVYEGKELPEGVTLADVINNDAEPQIVVTDKDGKVVEDVITKITAKGDEITIYFANFAWAQKYDVVAKYGVLNDTGVASMEVNVKFTVNTVDRNRETIIVNLEPSTVMFEPNLVMTKLYGDIMEPAFTQLVFGNEKHYDLPAKKWCEANFSLGQYKALDAIKADGKDVDAKNTMLLIDEKTGWEVSVAFDYNDFDFVPAQVEYTKTITTWYGQVVIVNKVINFEFPVYDFKHNSKYVYGADMDFYSQVQPEYTWYNDNEAEGLLKFDVAAVELRAAFSVVDAQGNKLSEDDMNKLSLSYNFEIEDTEHEGIDIDPATDRLSYYGSNPFVNVRGNLVITNKNGAQYVVPTSFDEGGKYASYNVVKFNPIGTAEVIMNPTIDVNNSIAYNVDILDYVKLEDYRTGGRQSYPLITDGAWVVGNGENGFAERVDVRADYMYRIKEVWVNDTADVDDEIRPYITLNNGTLTFDNSQQLALTAPFTIPVTLKFQNCWMEKPQQVTVNVTFNPIK